MPVTSKMVFPPNLHLGTLFVSDGGWGPEVYLSSEGTALLQRHLHCISDKGMEASGSRWQDQSVLNLLALSGNAFSIALPVLQPS